MKSIYEFSVSKNVEKEVKEDTSNGVLIKKVSENVPINIIFKKPNRLESQEADNISAIEYSESVRMGILTKPLLEKLYDEKGGFLADSYDSKYGQILMKFFELENEYRKLSLIDEKTPANDQRLKEVAAEFVRIQNNLQTLEASRNSLFQNTAETRAQNKTVLWLTLFLTYFQGENDEAPIAFFKGNTFAEKLEYYDQLAEESDEFSNKVIDKMSFFVALWYLGRASSNEDFKKIEKDYLQSPSDEKEVTAPEATKTDTESVAEEIPSDSEPTPEVAGL